MKKVPRYSIMVCVQTLAFILSELSYASRDWVEIPERGLVYLLSIPHSYLVILTSIALFSYGVIARRARSLVLASGIPAIWFLVSWIVVFVAFGSFGVN